MDDRGGQRPLRASEGDGREDEANDEEGQGEIAEDEGDEFAHFSGRSYRHGCDYSPGILI